MKHTLLSRVVLIGILCIIAVGVLLWHNPVSVASQDIRAIRGAVDVWDMMGRLDQIAFSDEVDELKFILDNLIFDALNDQLTISGANVRAAAPVRAIPLTGSPIIDAMNAEKEAIRLEGMAIMDQWDAPLDRLARDTHFSRHGNGLEGRQSLIIEFIDLLLISREIQINNGSHADPIILSVFGTGQHLLNEDLYAVFTSERYIVLLERLSEFAGIPIDMFNVEVVPLSPPRPMFVSYTDEDGYLVFICDDWIEYLSQYSHLYVDENGRLIHLYEWDGSPRFEDGINYEWTAL